MYKPVFQADSAGQVRGVSLNLREFVRKDATGLYPFHKSCRLPILSAAGMPVAEAGEFVTQLEQGNQKHEIRYRDRARVCL